MPSQILHTLFGEDVIAELYARLEDRFGVVAGKALEKIRNTYRAAFTLGCQGPDIFYHNQQRRPAALEYGSLLHRRGYGVFTAALLKGGLPDPPPDEDDIRQGRREKGISALGAYALGFMTHAVLDRAAHPYIVYKSVLLPEAAAADSPFTRRFPKGKGAHPFFERVLDTLMLEKLRGIPPSAWKEGTVLAEICADPPLGLRELLGRSLAAVFPERAGKDTRLTLRMENTFEDCAVFYRLTDPQCTSPCKPPPEDQPPIRDSTLTVLYPEQLSPEIDCLNGGRLPWRHPGPGGPEDCRSFLEIYRDAVHSTADALAPVIARYLAEGIFPIREAAAAIGNGGLSITDEQGKPAPPAQTSPLPLHLILEQQRFLRNQRHV